MILNQGVNISHQSYGFRLNRIKELNCVYNWIFYTLINELATEEVLKLCKMQILISCRSKYLFNKVQLEGEQNIGMNDMFNQRKRVQSAVD